MGEKKVKLDYAKVTVLVEKSAHGRGNAGSLTEEWASVCARGPRAAVESLVGTLRKNGKSLAAAKGTSDEDGSTFPTFLECGSAEFVALVASRVKPPPIPVTKRKSLAGETQETEQKLSKKQKKELAAAAGMVSGLTGLMRGVTAAVAKGEGPTSDKAKAIQATLDKVDLNMGSMISDEESSDDDDEPIVKYMPVVKERKKPGPKSKAEKAAMAAAAAAAPVTEPPVKEKKKVGRKSKAEKAAMEAKEDRYMGDGDSSDSDMPLAKIARTL